MSHKTLIHWDCLFDDFTQLLTYDFINNSRAQIIINSNLWHYYWVFFPTNWHFIVNTSAETPSILIATTWTFRYKKCTDRDFILCFQNVVSWIANYCMKVFISSYTNKEFFQVLIHKNIDKPKKICLISFHRIPLNKRMHAAISVA